MNPQSPVRAEPEPPVPTFSPRFALTSGSQRKIAIAVDLSDESAYAVRWAVQNYLRPGDAVILLHVRPTSVLYGADWGSVDLSAAEDADDGGGGDEESRRKLEDDFDNFTSTKASDLAHPLVEAQIPFKIHIVKDHDMKERLCLEVERLGLSAVIMGSRGFGASKRAAKGRLGSVSDYCVHHCVCPVVVVRYPEENDNGKGDGNGAGGLVVQVGEPVELPPVPEEEHEVNCSRQQGMYQMKKNVLELISIFVGQTIHCKVAVWLVSICMLLYKFVSTLFQYPVTGLNMLPFYFDD
ncbi:Universal stress protein PHOS34 [Glycine max]|nr:Universal stress protein PHOS34 [Glycine max]